jgi:predicted porin
MKANRTIIAAIVIAGAQAHAQSNVSLSGIADAGLYKRNLAGQTPSTQLQGGMLSMSRFDMRGSEDLGGGLRADFELSAHFRLDTGEWGRHPGDTMAGRVFTRASSVGLRGAWGQLRLGRVSTGTFVHTVQFTPYGDSTSLGPFMMHTFVGGQPMLAAHGGSDGVWSNSVVYNTPDLGGFTAQLQYAPGEGSTDGRRFDATGRFRRGPFAAGLSHSRIKGAAYTAVRTPTDPAGAPYAILEATNTLGSVSWDFRVAKVHGQAAKARLEPRGLPAIELTTVGVNAEVPLATGRLVGGWARTERAQAGASERRRGTLSFGYVHAFSRRTEWYTALVHDRATGLDGGTGIASGIKHVF